MKRAALIGALLLCSLPGVTRAQEIVYDDDVIDRGFRLKVEGGYLYQNLWGIGMNTGTLRIALGGDLEYVRLYGHVMAGAGRTQGGMRFVDIRPGFTTEIYFSKLHFGFELQFSPFFFLAATDGQPLFSFGVGGNAFIGYDFYVLERTSAFYIDITGGVRVLSGEDEGGNPSIGAVIGYRY